MTLFALNGLASAVAWFCVFVVLHILRWRSGRAHAGWLLRTYAGTLIAAIASAVVLTFNSADLLAAGLAMMIALLTSISLFVLYMPAVYVVLTSVSVQTIVLLRERGSALPVQTLYDTFAGPAIVADRLATLAANGYLRKDAEVFFLTPRGRRVARLFQWVKAVWRLGPGG